SIVVGLKVISGNLGHLAGALWNMGVGGLTMPDVARALYDRATHTLGSIVGGLKGISGNRRHLAGALWKRGVAGYTVGDVVGALRNLTGDARAIAEGLFHGIGLSWPAALSAVGLGGGAGQVLDNLNPMNW